MRAQGHIALATAVFPEGTDGNRLDLLARAPLWSGECTHVCVWGAGGRPALTLATDGLDYLHGTGHGAPGIGVYIFVFVRILSCRRGRVPERA